MRVAFSVWNDRISPVFDSSRRLLVLEIENGEIRSRREETFSDLEPLRKLSRLVEMKVEALVCGAISRSVAEMAGASGLQVYSFIAGGVEEVITAFLSHDLSQPRLLMPGCCRHGRRRRGESCWRQGRTFPPPIAGRINLSGERSEVMPQRDGTGPQGKGPGTGRGMGRCGGKGSGRPGSPPGAGPGQGMGQGCKRGVGQGRNRGS